MSPGLLVTCSGGWCRQLTCVNREREAFPRAGGEALWHSEVTFGYHHSRGKRVLYTAAYECQCVGVTVCHCASQERCGMYVRVYGVQGTESSMDTIESLSQWLDVTHSCGDKTAAHTLLTCHIPLITTTTKAKQTCLDNVPRINKWKIPPLIIFFYVIY